MEPLSLHTGSRKEGGKLTSLSGSFFVLGRACADGTSRRRGSLGADLPMGKMPAQLFDILVEGEGVLRGLPRQHGGNVLTHPSYLWLKDLLSFATSPTLWATRRSFWWSNLSHSCCLREPLSSAGPTPAWRADESYPHPVPP